MRAIFLSLLLALGLIALLLLSLPSPTLADSDALDFPGSENWDAQIGKINLTRTVHSLSFDKDYLYLGEGFGSGGKHIRRWNGTQWQSIANNVDGPVLDLLNGEDGKLYAGGFFTQTGTCNPCKRIAMWVDSTWSAVGNDIEGEIIALAKVQSGELYAGGDFGVKRWNGTTWESETITDTVYDLEVGANDLVYAAGRGFVIDPDNEDRIEFPSLKVKTPEGWKNLGESFVNSGPNTIFSLALYPDNVLTPTVGGDFGSPTFYLASWKNNEWQSIGTPDLDVLTLAKDTCGGLYVGGSFRKIDNSFHTMLAYYDGSEWNSLGDTFTTNSVKVEELDFYHGYLAVGGVFTQTLGLQNHRNIALWTGRDCAQITASGTYTFYNWREPVMIQITTLGTLTEIRVQRFNKNHPAADVTTTPNLKNGVYWQIEGLDSQGQAASGFVYTLTLPSIGFTPDEKDKICHYKGNSSWDCAASAYDPVKKTISRNGLTSFSDFTVGNDVGPTVISLKSFQTKTRESTFLVLVFLTLSIGCLINFRQSKR